MRTALILTILILFSTGCSALLPPPEPSTCPPPVKMTEPAKDALRACCTVVVDGQRRPAPGSGPIWSYLADVARLGEQLEACRG